MEAQVARGHRIVRGVCALMVATSVSVVLAYVVINGFDRIGGQLLRLFFTGLLAFALNRGDGWARWVTAVLVFLAAAVGMFNRTFLDIALAVLYLALGASLTFPRSVALRARRSLRRVGVVVFAVAVAPAGWRRYVGQAGSEPVAA